MASKRDLMIKKRRVRDTEPENELRPETKEPKAKPKKKKRRRQRSVVWPILFRLLLVVVLVMMGVLVWRNWDRLAPAALSEWMDKVVTGGEGGDGYPVPITGSSVVSMKSSGTQAAVLTDTSLLMYNTAGAEIVNRGHTYANPLLDTAGGYVLVAELGGNRYLLGNKKETVYSGQVANAILGAAVDSEGRVALATESTQSYMSEVLVLDRDGAELFHWYSVDQTVVDVALSPNGKRVAVLGLSAESGLMKSTVQIFTLAGGDGGAEHTYSATGAMMGALHYYQNGNVAVVGDTAAWVYDPQSDEAAVTDYSDATLLGYAFSDRGIGLVMRRFGESSGGTLTVVTPAGKMTGTEAFEGDYRHVTASDRGFYLLTSDALYDADTVGFAHRMTVAADGLQVVDISGRPLVLSLTTLTKYDWTEKGGEGA